MFDEQKIDSKFLFIRYSIKTPHKMHSISNQQNDSIDGTLTNLTANYLIGSIGELYFAFVFATIATGVFNPKWLYLHAEFFLWINMYFSACIFYYANTKNNFENVVFSCTLHVGVSLFLIYLFALLKHVLSTPSNEQQKTDCHFTAENVLLELDESNADNFLPCNDEVIDSSDSDSEDETSSTSSSTSETDDKFKNRKDAFTAMYNMFIKKNSVQSFKQFFDEFDRNTYSQNELNLIVTMIDTLRADITTPRGNIHQPINEKYETAKRYVFDKLFSTKNENSEKVFNIACNKMKCDSECAYNYIATIVTENYDKPKDGEMYDSFLDEMVNEILDIIVEEPQQKSVVETFRSEHDVIHDGIVNHASPSNESYKTHNEGL